MNAVTNRFPRYGIDLYAGGLAFLIVAPLAQPGYLLIRDGISTPRSWFSDAALGLSDNAPRAIPQDFFLALCSSLCDGGMVVKILLFLGLWLAGSGAARLVNYFLPNSPSVSSYLGVTVAIWNPYVSERLLQGNWSLLVGYGCLSWVILAVQQVHHHPDFSHIAVLAGWISFAGLTPTGLIISLVGGLVSAWNGASGWSRYRGSILVGLISVCAALPWLTVFQSSLVSRNPIGVHLFAARPEYPGDLLITLMGMGGIWNAQALPASRHSPLALLGTCLVAILVASGAYMSWRSPSVRVWISLAGIVLIVIRLLASSIGITTLSVLTEHYPGLGILRDTHKWLALVLPGYVLAIAAVPSYALRSHYSTMVGIACCVMMILVLPDLAWGVGGKIHSYRYPSGWFSLAKMINDHPDPVAVLPPGQMRHFSWVGQTPLLDPLPRWVKAHVYTSGDLIVDGQIIPGEGHHARYLEQAILNPDTSVAQLHQAGLGWIVIESDTSHYYHNNDLPTSLRSLSPTFQDQFLTAYYLGPSPDGVSSTRRICALGCHGLWLAMLLCSIALTCYQQLRRLYLTYSLKLR